MWWKNINDCDSQLTSSLRVLLFFWGSRHADLHQGSCQGSAPQTCWKGSAPQTCCKDLQAAWCWILCTGLVPCHQLIISRHQQDSKQESQESWFEEARRLASKYSCPMKHACAPCCCNSVKNLSQEVLPEDKCAKRHWYTPCQLSFDSVHFQVGFCFFETCSWSIWQSIHVWEASCLEVGSEHLLQRRWMCWNGGGLGSESNSVQENQISTFNVMTNKISCLAKVASEAIQMPCPLLLLLRQPWASKLLLTSS